MQVIIDRFEGDFAVVEMPDRQMVNLPRILIPEAKESDVIDISINSAATDEKKKKIESLMDDVWN